MDERLRSAVESIEQARVLDPLAERLQGMVARATSDKQIKNLLSGTWLGHPVHPPLTDVTIAALTGTTLLDLVPSKRTRAGAAVLLSVGLLSAPFTAAAGANDWADTTGRTRRVGVVHALGNTVTLLLYLRSLVNRWRGRRVRATLLSLLGLASLTASGYLGGHLAYRRGVGVDENAFRPFRPLHWERATPFDELPDGQLTAATVAGTELVLYRIDGTVYALADRCGHQGGPLHEGHVHPGERTVSCPWHHSTFRLTDGGVVRGPAAAPQPAYETRIREGWVEVRAIG